MGREGAARAGEGEGVTMDRSDQAHWRAVEALRRNLPVIRMYGNLGDVEAAEAALTMPTGWLIESTLSGARRPLWWQGNQSGTEEHWTPNSERAVRFVRREDAEACRLFLPDAHVSKVTEHIWL